MTYVSASRNLVVKLTSRGLALGSCSREGRAGQENCSSAKDGVREHFDDVAIENVQQMQSCEGCCAIGSKMCEDVERLLLDRIIIDKNVNYFIYFKYSSTHV